MKKLTDEQIAQRAVKRKNKKISEKYPLFAEQFKTTFEAELERIKKKHEESDRHLRKMREKSREAYQRGLQYREAAYAVLDAAKLDQLERSWRRRFPQDDPELHGHDFADHWWCALKGTEYAKEHCPNRHLHNEKWPPTYHYLLERFVPTTHCPTCGAKLNEECDENTSQTLESNARE